MPSLSESGTEEETSFPDVLRAMQHVLQGLSELAGLDGFDTLAEKINEAEEECEQLLTQILRTDGMLWQKEYDNVHQASPE